MKLFPISSANRLPFSTHCATCGAIIYSDRDHDARADADGPAFAAYYCGKCVAASEEAHRQDKRNT